MTTTKRKTYGELFTVTEIVTSASTYRVDKRRADISRIDVEIMLSAKFGNAESHEEKHTLKNYFNTTLPSAEELMRAADAKLTRNNDVTLRSVRKSDHHERSNNSVTYTWSYRVTYEKTKDMPTIPEFTGKAYDRDYEKLRRDELAWGRSFLGIPDLSPLEAMVRADAANIMDANVNDSRCREANRLAREMSNEARERAEKITRYTQRLAALRAELVEEREIQAKEMLDGPKWVEDTTYDDSDKKIGVDVMRAARAGFRDYFGNPSHDGGFRGGRDDTIKEDDFAKVRAEVKAEEAKAS